MPKSSGKKLGRSEAPGTAARVFPILVSVSQLAGWDSQPKRREEGGGRRRRKKKGREEERSGEAVEWSRAAMEKKRAGVAGESEGSSQAFNKTMRRSGKPARRERGAPHRLHLRRAERHGKTTSGAITVDFVVTCDKIEKTLETKNDQLGTDGEDGRTSPALPPPPSAPGTRATRAGWRRGGAGTRARWRRSSTAEKESGSSHDAKLGQEKQEPPIPATLTSSLSSSTASLHTAASSSSRAHGPAWRRWTRTPLPGASGAGRRRGGRGRSLSSATTTPDFTFTSFANPCLCTHHPPPTPPQSSGP